MIIRKEKLALVRQPLMKQYIFLLLYLPVFTSCLSDEEKRLQTDQTFEGEEMFNLSYALDEHSPYAFYAFTFYQDTVNHSAIPGCPSVSINEADYEVVLTFGEGECATNRALRSGKLIVSYLDSVPGRGNKVRVGYQDYWVKGLKVEGFRTFHLTDSTATGITLTDSISDIVITDANRSTSKLNGAFVHELFIENASLQYFTTTGSGSGRNLTGRPFVMEINEAKRFTESCLQAGYHVAESGRERWTFERTGTPHVIHTLSFEQAEDCDHTAAIQLDDGGELLINQ